MSWQEVRIIIEHLPPTGESAYFRSRYPKSWWWSPEIDFHAAVLLAVQAGNWQRGGGKGDKPKPFLRPKEVKTPDMSRDDLELRKKRLKAGRNGN